MQNFFLEAKLKVFSLHEIRVLRIARRALSAFVGGLSCLPAPSLVLGLVLLGGGQAAWATTDEVAVELCVSEMLRNQSAMAVVIDEVRRQNRVPFVYGDADFADAKRVHFRCRVYNEKVTSVKYLVPDPEFLTGTGWSPVRPRGADHVDLDLNEAAKAPPAAGTAEAHFEKVPTTSE